MSLPTTVPGNLRPLESSTSMLSAFHTTCALVATYAVSPSRL